MVAMVASTGIEGLAANEALPRTDEHQATPKWLGLGRDLSVSIKFSFADQVSGPEEVEAQRPMRFALSEVWAPHPSAACTRFRLFLPARFV